MGSGRGHSDFLISSALQKAVQRADLTMTGSIGFDIGSDFSHFPPFETTSDYLNPPPLSACLDCEFPTFLQSVTRNRILIVLGAC